MLLKQCFVCLLLADLSIGVPQNDKALFPDGPEPEDRRRKQQRPCRGPRTEGRTFLDWSFQYLDVNYNTNYNYNINCGGNNRPQRPQGGGGLLGNGGILSNHLQNHQNGGGLLGSLLNRPQNGGNRPILGNPNVQMFVQTQTASLGDSIGNLFSQNLPQLPQGGLFNGQGIGSLFENGLFSGIFNNNQPAASAPQVFATPSPPLRPQRPQPVSIAPTDPDDIIYNDEKPVHEPHDPVVPDPYANLNRPGQYLIANNPVFGSHTVNLGDLFDFNPRKIAKNRIHY